MLLFGCHVVWWEVRVSDRGSRYLWMIVDIFGRVNSSFAIHPVLVASCRFRRVEASLNIEGSVEVNVSGYLGDNVPE